MIVNSILRAATLFGLLLTCACASVTQGSTQTVTVITEPAGAICELKRGGTMVAIVNPTPGSVTVDKSKDDITISCTKPEHETVAQLLSSKFQGATIGNAILGGGIGLIIDAASGAMYYYPDSIDLLVPPLVFESAQARDSFYDLAKTTVTKRYAEEKKKTSEDCNRNNVSSCDQPFKALDEKRDAELAALDARRAAAKVRDI